MQNNININNLRGIQKNIAQKCDKNGDGVLQSWEASIFNQACSSISGDTYILDGKAYNSDGSLNYTRKVQDNSIFSFHNNRGVQSAQNVGQAQSVNNTQVQNDKPAQNTGNISAPPPEKIVEKNDATRVAPRVNSAAVRYVKPAPLTAASDVRTNYKWSESAFNKMIDKMTVGKGAKFKSSVLRGKAKAFIEAGNKYGVDPRFLLAIAMCESGRGISNRAKTKHDVGGLGGNYNTVDDCIYAIARTINTNCKKGRKTAATIAMPYTCSAASAPSWKNDVTAYMGQATAYYGNAIA